MSEPLVFIDPSDQQPVDNLLTDESKNRLIEFLRFIFERSEQYTFNDDEIESKISISDIYPKKEDTEKKPAIVVRRENMMLTNRGVGHFLGWTYSKNFGSKFMDLLQTQVVIECYSREGLEAEKIANMVFASILFYRRKLRTVGRVHDILSAGIGPEVPQRVSSEITLAMVPVHVSFTHTEVWTTEEIGKDLFNGVILEALIKDP